MKFLAIIAVVVATVAAQIPPCVSSANLNLVGILSGDATACAAALTALKACPPGEAKSLEDRLAARCAPKAPKAAKGKGKGKMF